MVVLFPRTDPGMGHGFECRSEEDGLLTQCSVLSAGSWSSGPMETLGDSGGQSQMIFLLGSREARLLQPPSALLLEDCFHLAHGSCSEEGQKLPEKSGGMTGV